MDKEINEETTQKTPRFSPSTSTPFTTTTNSLVSNTKSFTPDYTTNEIPTSEDEITQSDETSENPTPIAKDETTENPTSITEDQTSEILFSSIEPTNEFSTVKLNTLLTTNSRATFKATVASTKSTSTKAESPSSKANRYIFERLIFEKYN